VMEEVFADRAYADNGTLMPRSVPGAVLHDAAACVTHVMQIVRTGALHSVHGVQLPVRVQSICVHGDNAKAVDSARAIVAALKAEAWDLVSLPTMAHASA
jgi:5-oxoprolinase (ATP-hydrolysing) subunit A